MSQSKKRVDITGLRVYSRARRAADDGSPLEWHPAPRAPGAPERLRAPVDPARRARCDDRVDPDDVMLVEMLTASLTVTARERSRPATTSGAASSNAHAPGFDVRVEVLSAVGDAHTPESDAQRDAPGGRGDGVGAAGQARRATAPGRSRREKGVARVVAVRRARSDAGDARRNPRLPVFGGRELHRRAADVTGRRPRRDGRAIRGALRAQTSRRSLPRAPDPSGCRRRRPCPRRWTRASGRTSFSNAARTRPNSRGTRWSRIRRKASSRSRNCRLAARAQAEQAAYADEEEDEAEDFLDAEEFDEDDDSSKSSGGYFSRVTGALYKCGAGIATNAVGLATSAAARVADGATRYAVSSGATSVFAPGEASANGRTLACAAGIVVELRSFTAVFRKGSSSRPRRTRSRCSSAAYAPNSTPRTDGAPRGGTESRRVAAFRWD